MINAAYEARDLLALLELQLRLERIATAESLEAIAGARIDSYIRVLEQQSEQLLAELDAIELPLRFALGQGPRRAITPEMVRDRIRADARSVEKATAQLAQDLSSFEDLAQLEKWLRDERAASRRRPGRSDDLPFDVPF